MRLYSLESKAKIDASLLGFREGLARVQLAVERSENEGLQALSGSHEKPSKSSNLSEKRLVKHYENLRRGDR